ncbi:MAG: hypothetical protein VX498_01760 [Myxococcota bacterium]|nr:hypothetical protein [Myxococcota bacterium]
MRWVDIEHQKREQWLFVGEVWLTILVTLILMPVLIDLWAYTFTELGARMEHAIVVIILWPIELARNLGGLAPLGEPASLGVPLLILAVYSGVLTALAALIDPPPGSKPSLPRRLAAVPWCLVAGTPLLVGALALIVVAVALDPSLFVVVVLMGLLGGLVGRKRRRESVPWERSLTGLPPAFWRSDHSLRFAILFGASALLLLGGSLIGLPFDEAPMRAALIVDETIAVTGPQILPWAFGLFILLVSVLAPPTRRAADLMSWEPWAAGAVCGVLTLILLSGRGWVAGREAFPLGFGMGYLGTLMAGGGVPWLPRLSANPLRAVGRLGLPLAASLAVSVHILGTAFLGCDELQEDPRLQFLSDLPGASAIEYAESLRGPAVFATFRTASKIARFETRGGKHVALRGDQLPLDALKDPSAAVRPKVLGRGPGGSLFAISEVVPGQGPSTTALVELDPTDLGILAAAEDFDVCNPSSWAWNPDLGVGLLGCGDDGQLILYEKHLQSFISRESLRGAREVHSVAVDIEDGSVLTLARRKSPFLTRFDLTSRVPVDWQFVGLFNMAVGLQGEQILLPRFLGRQVLLLDRSTLKPLKSRPAGFALASLVQSEKRDRAFAGSLLDGHIYAVPIKGEAETKRIRIGGWISDLSLSPDSRTLYAASMCGVTAINLELWLDD